MTAKFVQVGVRDASFAFDDRDPDSPWTLVAEGEDKPCYLRDGDPSWTLHIDHPNILAAQFEEGHGLSPNANDVRVLLHGKDEGNAVLSVRQGHVEKAHLRVRVASQKTVLVKFFFVTDATGKGPQVWSPAFAQRVLHRISFIYRSQANVICQYYGHQHIKIPDLNFAAKSTTQKEMEQATGHIWDQLENLAQDSALNVFFNVFCVHVWAVRDTADDDAFGTSNENVCVIEDFIANQNHAVLLAHEMGHFLQFQHHSGHNNASRRNLMHEYIGTYGGEVLNEGEIKRIRRTFD